MKSTMASSLEAVYKAWPDARASSECHRELDVLEAPEA